MTAKKTTAVHKPTCNGITKGRPGKGRVLSLGQRKTCYAKHAMTPDNTFTYKGREWCRKCRAASRRRSVVKRLAEAKRLAAIKAKEDRNAIKDATAKAGDKPTAKKTGKGSAKKTAKGSAKAGAKRKAA